MENPYVLSGIRKTKDKIKVWWFENFIIILHFKQNSSTWKQKVI